MDNITFLIYLNNKTFLNFKGDNTNAAPVWAPREESIFHPQRFLLSRAIFGQVSGPAHLFEVRKGLLDLKLTPTSRTRPDEPEATICTCMNLAQNSSRAAQIMYKQHSIPVHVRHLVPLQSTSSSF